MVIAWLLACTASEPAEPHPPAEPIAVAPEPEPEPEAAPAGRIIAAAPILEKPTILGGIDNDTVAAALDLGAIKGCNQAGRPGKVLVHFRVLASGAVGTAEVRSTTLRHPETEACVLERISATSFPELTRGEYALVTWPFSI